MRVEDLIAAHVLPIALCAKSGNDYKPLGIVGTGFTFGEGTFVTCWHCVAAPPSDGQAYGAAVREGGVFSARYSHIYELVDLAQDTNASDLAIARLGVTVEPTLSLADAPFAWGHSVVAVGYPLPSALGTATDEPTFLTSARVLRGYVTRIIVDDRPGWPPIRAYELDMTAPPGISGSPLLDAEGPVVGGVVYGRTQDIVPKSESDELTYAFATAHHLDTLRAATGPATGGRRLEDYLR